jgi:hypothetical protein
MDETNNFPIIPLRLDKWLVRATQYTHIDVIDMWSAERIEYIPDPNCPVAQKMCTKVEWKKVDSNDLYVFPGDIVKIDGEVVACNSNMFCGQVYAFYKPWGVTVELPSDEQRAQWRSMQLIYNRQKVRLQADPSLSDAKNSPCVTHDGVCEVESAVDSTLSLPEQALQAKRYCFLKIERIRYSTFNVLAFLLLIVRVWRNLRPRSRYNT